VTTSAPRHRAGARWLPALGAAALIIAVVAAWALDGDGGSGTTASATSVVEATLGGGETVPADQQIVVDPSEQVAKVPLDRTLTMDANGNDVTRLQERLSEMAFDPGPIDGAYGSLTRQAVWAYEKLVLGVSREQATGVVTPEMWDSMQDTIAIRPRRPTGGLADHTEVYLPEQVMIVFHADVPALVAHVSSGELNPDGSPAQYCEDITVDSDVEGNLLPEPVTKPICGL